MTNTNIYTDISRRTGGNIYIGIVGPVRTGKSTFIKRFMDTLVIPNIENVYMKERAKDELPQSGSGKMIMTAEPKFVPEDAVSITLDDTSALSIRLVDCVGYMVDGALGQFDGEHERMVTTPWFPNEIPMREAAETGTRKVICEHSTIGIVITTDGSITEIPRADYVPAEDRVIRELKELGKPFVVLVNSANPSLPETQALRDKIKETYGVSCLAVDCMSLDKEGITDILKTVLFEFPVTSFGVFLPPWVDALEASHPLKKELFDALRKNAEHVHTIQDAELAMKSIRELDSIHAVSVRKMDLGTGEIQITAKLPRERFYETLSQQSGFAIADDGDLVPLLTSLSSMKKEYDRVAEALNEVRTRGYGIVMPDKEELQLQEPEIVKQGGRYGVRLKASAPSIHMIMADVETEVSPAVGGERSSEDIINFLLQEFEGNVGKIWESNIFGKSLYEIASEGLSAKIKRMPEDAQEKLRETLQRIINEGSSGLICIIL